MSDKVAILLVVTNEEKHIITFINSLKNQSYSNVSLYVLDNNCNDDSIELIRNNYTDPIIIRCENNHGFARGNNILAKKAIKDGMDYLFIINPDVELEKNCIGELVSFLRARKNVGAVAPIIFYGLDKRNDNIIQNYIINADYKTRKAHSINANERYNPDIHPEFKEVNMINGGVTFIRSSVFNEVGFFEESYFMYGDEFDIGKRIIDKGIKLFVTNKAKTWHHHDWSKNNKKGNKIYFYYKTRAKYLYFYKFKTYNQLVINLFKDIVQFPLNVRWFIKKKDIGLLKIFYLAVFHGIRKIKGPANFEIK